MGNRSREKFIASSGGLPIIPYGPGMPYATVNDLPDYAGLAYDVVNSNTLIKKNGFYNTGTKYINFGRGTWINEIDVISKSFTFELNHQVLANTTGYILSLADSSSALQVAIQQITGTGGVSYRVAVGQTVIRASTKIYPIYSCNKLLLSWDHSRKRYVFFVNGELLLDGVETTANNYTSNMFIGGRTTGTTSNVAGRYSDLIIRGGFIDFLPNVNTLPIIERWMLNDSATVAVAEINQSNNGTYSVNGLSPIWIQLDESLPTLQDFWGEMPNMSEAMLRDVTKPLRIGFYGDSNVAGAGAGATYGGEGGAFANCFAQKFADALGYQSGSFFGNQGMYTATLEQFDPRINKGSGSMVTDYSPTLGSHQMKFPMGMSSPMAFTPSQQFDKIVIWYAKGSMSDSVSILLDAVSIGTINSVGINGELGKAEFSCALGNHVVSMLNQSATADFILVGIETFDSTSGTPVVLQLGDRGLTLPEGMTETYGVSNYSHLKALDLDVIILFCTINEVVNYTNSEILSHINAFLDGLSGLSVDVVLCTHWPVNDVSTGNGRLQELAVAYNLIARSKLTAMFDCRYGFTWLYTPSNALGLAYDGLHPSVSGHSIIANHMASGNWPSA